MPTVEHSTQKGIALWVGAIENPMRNICQDVMQGRIIPVQHALQVLTLTLVLVSARTAITPVTVVFPEADKEAAAIGTTRSVSITRIVLIRCSVVASMIILK